MTESNIISARSKSKSFRRKSSMQSLTLNSKYLFSTSSNDYGIKQETITNTKSEIESAIHTVNQNIENKKYGFISTLDDTDLEQKTQSAYEQLSWVRYFVVIGIGGSDLGGRALMQALEKEGNSIKVLFHGDSTDPIAIKKLLMHIDLSQTVFNVISKSGETVETISQYVFLKETLKQHKLEWNKHFVFTTDKEKGILKEEADKYNILTVPIPSNVGGRFSVLTPVGTLPARMMGINTKELLQGAKDITSDNNILKLAQEIASTQYQLYQQGIKLAVLTPYSTQLEEWARWYRQLWAESLGKNNKGILPIQARGPADQHSQYQFYNQGSPLASYWHIQVDNRDTDFKIESTDVEAGKFLVGHSFHQIINAEQHAAALSLQKNGRPVATLHINEISAYPIGQLIICFETAVVYLAEMLQVNAFDQPGVEEGKQFMYALLNKPGYEAKREEINQL